MRDLVKLGGDNFVKNFEDKFKELRVEGCRKDRGSSSSVMYTKDGEKVDEDIPTVDFYPDADGDGYGDAKGQPKPFCKDRIVVLKVGGKDVRYLKNKED